MYLQVFLSWNKIEFIGYLKIKINKRLKIMFYRTYNEKPHQKPLHYVKNLKMRFLFFEKVSKKQIMNVHLNLF